MAIFKRYNSRKKRFNWRIVIWLGGILTVFIITAIIGNHLGQKAKGAKDLTPKDSHSSANTSTAAPISDGSVHGQYVSPEDIAKFKTDDPTATVGTWLYKDGVSNFKTETDTLLNKNVKGLPPLSSFDIETGTYGLFEVTAVYADEKVYDIIASYEISLIDEYSDTGLNELVLVFNEVTEDNYEEIIDFAAEHGKNKVICIPYEVLSEEFCSRLFAKAQDNQITVTLMIRKLKSNQLREDIETFAFYFTRYNMRLLLSGDYAHLLDVLKENNLFNYQFYSPVENED